MSNIVFGAPLLVLFAVMSPLLIGSRAVNSDRCKDKQTWCEQFQGYGYCIIYSSFMSVWCEKTCGLCKETEKPSLSGVTIVSTTYTSEFVSTTIQQQSTRAKPSPTITQQISTITESISSISQQPSIIIEPTLLRTKQASTTIHPSFTTNQKASTSISLTTTRSQLQLFRTSLPTVSAATIALEPCGFRTVVNNRIVGGAIALRNAWPWMVQFANKVGFVFCGGSLISSEWIVTAAHCFRGSSVSDVVVRLGAHFRNVTITNGIEQTSSLSKIIKHPGFEIPLPLSNDIALVKLNSPASINPKVSPVCVPTENSPSGFEPKKMCYVTGWGRLTFFGDFAPQLMQAKVPIQPHTTCSSAYPNLVDDSMVCAGPAQGGVDACLGDSGGPLVCSYKNNRWYLEGVVSWGDRCAVPGKYGVYAKLRHFSSWMRKTMKAN